MFGNDPIDLFDPSPYLAISYYGHLLIGLVSIIAALVAFASRKGSKRHVLAGKVFIVSVLLVCVTTASMLSDVFIGPLFLAAVSATYVVLTGYLALKPGVPWVRRSEYGLFCAEIAGTVLFLTFALPEVAAGNAPFFGPPVLIAIPLILMLGDVNWFLKSDQRQRLRAKRHLARMVWAIIIVVRAPLVEIAAAGVPIPPPVLLLGPFVIAPVMLLYFQRRYGDRGV